MRPELDLEQALEFVAEGACRLTGAGGAAIALREGASAVCRGRSGPLAPALGARVDPQSGVCGLCLSTGELQLCDDTESDQRVHSPVAGMRSILAVPLRRREDVVGIIVVFSDCVAAFGLRDIRTLKLLAGLVVGLKWPTELPDWQASPGSAESAAVPPSLGQPEPIAPRAKALEAPARNSAVGKARSPAPPSAAPAKAKPGWARRMVPVMAGVALLAAAAAEVGLRKAAEVREFLDQIQIRISTLAPRVDTHVSALAEESDSLNPALLAEKVADGFAAWSAAERSQLLAIRTWLQTDSTTMFPPAGHGQGRTTRAGFRHPRIVLDAGHGGYDSGSVGHGGLKEKDFTLQIARRLGALLSSRLGAQVIFTRSGDVSVPLEERAAIANQADADLLISIHANSSDDPEARGVETYVVGGYPSAAAAGGALKPVAEPGNLGHSRALAAEVQRELFHAMGERDEVMNRGVKEAPFVLLLGAEMPAVLAEVAFLTNPGDEHRLSTPEGQEAVADALCRGIANYLAAARQNKTVAARGHAP